MTQRPGIRILRVFLATTQILAKAMSGWNDGGRGERGNRRMFDPEEVSLGDEDVSDLGRAFNPIDMQQHEKGDDKTYFGSS